MGVVNHNAVIATTWNKELMADTLDWIEGLRKSYQALFIHGAGWCNNEHTIVLIPDGSKEGWEESKFGDSLRKVFIEQLERNKYDDGSSPWRWVEVGYGTFGQKVLRGNNKNCYDDRDYAGDA